jgi:oligopeptide transport system substrate-binding protein
MLVFLLAGVTIFASACSGGGNASATNPPATAAGSAATQVPAESGETSVESVPAEGAVYHPAPGEMGEPFIYYQAEDLSTLNYLVTNKAVDAEDGYINFVDTLVETDKFAQLTADIATEWEVSDDQLTWTFHLRDDVKWVKSDATEYGAAVTAHDFVTSAKYVLDPYHASMNSFFLTDFIAGSAEYYEALSAHVDEADYKDKRETYADFSTVGVKAIDDYTLQYTLKAPAPFFISVTTYGVYLPLNEQFLNEIGEDNFGTGGKDSILYCGGFTLTDWQLDIEKTLTKNPNYFQADRIHIPYMRFFSISDDVVPLELYKRDEISAVGITTMYLDQMMSDPAYMDNLYVTKTSSASWYWFFNTTSNNPDFVTAALNENFRYAMFHSFNKDPYLRTINPQDEGVDMMNSGSYMPPELCITEDGKDYTSFGRLPEFIERNKNNHDPAKAKEFLEKAKAELGDSVKWPLTVRILGTTAETSKTRTAIIKQELETTLGAENIVVEVVIYTSDTYYDVIEGNGYDFSQQGWSADYADPSNYLGTWLKDNDVARGYDNFTDVYPQFEALYNEANTTYDIDARYEKFAEAEALMYEHCIFIPFNYTGGNYAISKIQNPYDDVQGMYGCPPDKFTDVIYGLSPISAEQRAAAKAEYDAEKAALGQ